MKRRREAERREEMVRGGEAERREKGEWDS
jgi:hypothetical protein